MSALERFAWGRVPGFNSQDPGQNALFQKGTIELPTGGFVTSWLAGTLGSKGAGGILPIGATYRSRHAQPGSYTADKLDPSTPFGPGWNPSWFQALQYPLPDPTGNVAAVWVDSKGISREYEGSTGSGTYGPLSTTAFYTYDSQKNARLIYDVARGVWYREYADRVRVEFVQVNMSPQSGDLAYQVGRICRGSTLVAPTGRSSSPMPPLEG